MPYIKQLYSQSTLGNNNKKNGAPVVPVKLNIWNNKTNHIILSVPVKIRHDRGCLVNKNECKGSSKLKGILHSKLDEFLVCSNCHDTIEHGVRSIEP